MSESRVRVAVFGLGRAGLYHLPNLAAHPEVVVQWLVDVAAMADRAGSLKEQFALDHARFADADHCQCVFDDASTNAVVIATPSSRHEAVIKRAVAAGKNVLCEKPISLTADQVRSCYAEAQKHGCTLFCAFNKRFDEHHLELRDKIRSGDLGSLRVIHYNARDPKTSKAFVDTYIQQSGGIFCDSAIHQLDYLVWIIGEKPSSLMVVGERTSEEAEAYRAADDVDAVMITLRFPSGIRAHLEVMRESQKDFHYYRMEAVGTQGTYLSHKVTNTSVTTVAVDGTGQESKHPLDIPGSFQAELHCFVRVVQGAELCPVLAEDAVLASHLADLCKVSLNEQRVINL